MKTEIQKALDNIRPYLQADNGDVELVDVTEDGIVKVKLIGACEIMSVVCDDFKSWNRKRNNERSSHREKN